MRHLGLMVAIASLEGCCLQSVTGGTSAGLLASASSAAATGGTNGGRPASGASTTAAAATSTGGGTSAGTGGATSSGGSTACNPPCGQNQVCAGGQCECVPGYSLCGASCVDEQIDNSNCGHCGNTCPGPACLGGICSCDTSVCPLEDGGAACVDVEVDPENCGFCGHVCAAPVLDCVLGDCVCPGSQTLCVPPPDGGVQAVCVSTIQDADNCGTCGYNCADQYGSGSGCRFGTCICAPGQSHLCAVPNSGASPSCSCLDEGTSCATLSFTSDVYPLLAQQSGAFGCAASGCHSGATPAGSLAFLDQDGELDAGLAYSELLVGSGGGGGDAGGVPSCDAGVPPGAPSTQCACVSRVVPYNAFESYLVDVIQNDPPCPSEAMPIDDAGNWLPLSACDQQIIEQWVATGASL